jgi:hypothetical protein
MENNIENKYPCPCCGYFMFAEGPGSFEICDICFWQDDLIDLEEMYEPWGPNRVSLEDGQKNFADFGATEKRFLEHVRSVNTNDVKEPKWRMLDRSKDNPKDINPEATNFKDLYYWYWN